MKNAEFSSQIPKSEPQKPIDPSKENPQQPPAESPSEGTLKYSSLISTPFTKFRNVLLQGELLKFYILVKCDKKNVPSAKEVFEQLQIKIEFEPTNISASEKKNNSDSEYVNYLSEYTKSLSDLFSNNLDKIENRNSEYENITYREFNQKDETMLYELFKQIVVPKEYLNKNLIMKIHLVAKENLDFIQEMNALDIYQSGYYNLLDQHKILKTFYKEIQIIRAIELMDIKQTDMTMDTTLIQARLENKTSLINFIDGSLKHSKFILKKKNTVSNASPAPTAASTDSQSNPPTEEKEAPVNQYGININIKEIQILNDETTLDEKSTSNINAIKQYIIKNDKVSLNNINFSLFDVELPIIIRPGEELNLTLKVNKSPYLNEQEEEKLKKKKKISGDDDDEAEGQEEKSIFDIGAANILKTLPSKLKDLGKFQLFNKEKDKEVQNRDELNPMQTLANFNPSNFKIEGQKNYGEEEENKEESNGEEEYNWDTENYNIFFSTPIILKITSDIFYDDLFMCLQVKWTNEVNRFLKVEINYPEKISLHEYFNVSLKCKNISKKEMNLCIEIFDYDGQNENKFETQEFEERGVNRNLPVVISKTKFENFGLFNCNEDKIFNLTFFALKNGFCNLPDFLITDAISGKKFHISNSNKFFVLG
ncbi:MAG: hypothetical protein MJ252_26470 [archaeon]|nr:hypothetical protein [archaeon]